MDTPVLILGGGTFGLSTAYHLAEAGWMDITVLDKAASLPSEFSAGYDLNKIVRAEYPDSFYSERSLEAIEAWRTPLFAPFYRETGYLITNSARAPAKTIDTLRRFRASVSTHSAFAAGIVSIETRDDIRRVAPAFDGACPGWTGYFNKRAGYARAADTMAAVYAHCRARGVRFALGDAVQSLNYAANGACTGATTVAGTAYAARITIVALGAYAAEVLPSLGRHQRALGIPVAHIDLSPAEAEALKGIPVTYCRDLGFLFQPDPDTRRIKLCPATGGYLYPGVSPDGPSRPPADPRRFTFTPRDDEQRLRQLLRELLPALADRPFVDTRFCWFMDTKDQDYIIDFVPGTSGLVAVSGDSGHGYKMLPVLGRWVHELLEAGHQSRPRWKWKGDEARPVVNLLPYPTRRITDPELQAKL